MTTSKKAIALAAIVTVAGAHSAAIAAIDWTGESLVDGLWSTNENWAGGLAPGSSDIANFPSLAVTPTRLPLVNGVAVSGVQIDNGGGYLWNINRNNLTDALTLGADGMTVIGGGAAQILVAKFNISADQNWTIAANTTLQLLATNGGGELAGTGKITKLGAGTLMLADVTSTHTGGIDVKAGVLVNPRGTNGTGGITNLVSIYDTAVYESRANNANVMLRLYNGSTVRGLGVGATLKDVTGQQGIKIDSAAGTKVTLTTVSAADELTLLESVTGGAADSVVSVKGDGIVHLKGDATSATDDGINTYLGSWKVESGTLSIEAPDALSRNTSATPASRAIEVAGGALRLALNGNATTTLGVTAAKSAVTISGNSSIFVERTSTANSGNTVRNVGTLGIGGQTLNVASGKFINTSGSNVTLNTTAVTLSGTPTINVVNGVSTGADSGGVPQAVNMIVELGAVGETGGSRGLIKTGTGRLHLTSGANTFTGATTVNGGILRFANSAGLATTSAVQVAAGATVELQNSTNNSTWTTKADLTGSGVVQLFNTGTTLALQGSGISPGNSPGVLSINGANLSLAADGAELTSLNIEVSGGGAVAGIDYDQLAVAMGVSGLPNAKLQVSISGVTEADLAGDVLTILTSTTNFQGLLSGSTGFSSVTFANGWSGNVNYNNGSITLSNLALVPEPAAIAFLGMTALTGLGRRRRVRD